MAHYQVAVAFGTPLESNKSFWYEADAGPGNPSLTFGSVNNPTGFVATKSSGVSHVPANQAFSYTVSATNLTGQLYLKENAYGTLAKPSSRN